MCSHTASAPYASVKSKVAPSRAELQRVVALEKAELVHGDEVRLVDQVRTVDGRGAEAQVRDRARAGLLRVVDEVALHEAVGLFADDLDRVLVGTDGAVAAEAPEHGAHHAALVEPERRVDGEAGVGDVVVDADGEMILRRCTRAASSKIAFTMAGVNSLDESP